MRFGWIAFIFACSATAFGSPLSETDLSPAPPVRKSVSVDLKPDTVQVGSASSSPWIQVSRMNHGSLTPVSELPFSSPPACPEGSSTRISIVLGNEHFAIRSPDQAQTYRIVADVPCARDVQLIFNSDSDGGQALGIWQIAAHARAKLKQAIGLTFWRSKISFIWPDSGDYYRFHQVHLTRGDHWDVVGHEMGHAIYDLGSLGEFGGGEHKIDECYSKELALSEGWASFFSAWVSVDPADSDAKFEFLVPRRAPIRFETIPGDVCKGETNEWRVTGFFWDLLDTHDDGEKMTESFARIWRPLEGSRSSSTSEAMERIAQAGIDRSFLQAIWNLNFD